MPLIAYETISRESPVRGVLWEKHHMFAGNDYTAIKSSAIDSAWTEVRSNFLFCAKSHPNDEIRSFQSGGSEIP